MPARIISATVTALLAVVLAMAIAGNAHACTLRHPTPTHTACAAFARWNHHRTTANLKAMLAASRHANAVVRTDITVDAYDVTHNYYLDLPGDVAGTIQDCKGK